MLYVAFNGPPRSGKSTAAWMLREQLQGRFLTMQESFAAPMKHFVATAMGERYRDMNKDKPRALWRGQSVRQVLIHMSEYYLKERYGDEIFGQLLVERVANLETRPQIVIIDDTGFEQEWSVCRPGFLIRIEREGCDFSYDSRSYHSQPDATVINNGDLFDLDLRLQSIAEDIRRRFND